MKSHVELESDQMKASKLDWHEFWFSWRSGMQTAVYYLISLYKPWELSGLSLRQRKQYLWGTPIRILDQFIFSIRYDEQGENLGKYFGIRLAWSDKWSSYFVFHLLPIKIRSFCKTSLVVYIQSIWSLWFTLQFTATCWDSTNLFSCFSNPCSKLLKLIYIYKIKRHLEF